MLASVASLTLHHMIPSSGRDNRELCHSPTGRVKQKSANLYIYLKESNFGTTPYLLDLHRDSERGRPRRINGRRYLPFYYLLPTRSVPSGPVAVNFDHARDQRFLTLQVESERQRIRRQTGRGRFHRTTCLGAMSPKPWTSSGKALRSAVTQRSHISCSLVLQFRIDVRCQTAVDCATSGDREARCESATTP